jgi:tRNA 2-thiouridine synthesizing protein A
MSEVTTRDSDAQPSSEASEAAEAQPALELDCRGMNCPLPILKTKKAIDGLEVGQVLRMIATDPGSIPDVAAFSRRTGHEILEQSEGGGEYSFLIRKV